MDDRRWYAHPQARSYQSRARALRIVVSTQNSVAKPVTINWVTPKPSSVAASGVFRKASRTLWLHEGHRVRVQVPKTMRDRAQTDGVRRLLAHNAEHRSPGFPPRGSAPPIDSVARSTPCRRSEGVENKPSCTSTIRRHRLLTGRFYARSRAFDKTRKSGRTPPLGFRHVARPEPSSASASQAGNRVSHRGVSPAH